MGVRYRNRYQMVDVDLASWRWRGICKVPFNVNIYVDFVRATGLYESAQDQSWVDAHTPTRVLTAPGFLKASGLEVLATRRRLYHVETERYLPAASFGEVQVREGDTLVIVNSDDPLFDDPRAVDALWQVTGGAERRAIPRRPTTRNEERWAS